MLHNLIRRNEIDIVFIQEVTEPGALELRGYTLHHNMGASTRCTAILAKNAHPLVDITREPSGRAIAASLHGIRLINVYAPAGTAKRQERELLYTRELPALLYNTHCSILLGGILIACYLRKIQPDISLVEEPCRTWWTDYASQTPGHQGLSSPPTRITHPRAHRE
jgi:exonuclease III